MVIKGIITEEGKITFLGINSTGRKFTVIVLLLL